VENQPLLRNKRFLSIFSIAFIIYISNYMVMQTIPLYADTLGASAQMLGMVSGIFSMCALLMRPFSGQLSDTEDKTILLRLVIVGLLVSVFGLAFSRQIWLLLLFRGLGGFAWGAGSTVCVTIASGCFAKENLGAGIGVFGLGQTIAQAFAPMLALKIGEFYGYSFLYQLNIGIFMAAFALTFLFKAEKNVKRTRKYSLNLKEMVCFAAIPPASLGMSNYIAQGAVTAFLIIFAHSLEIWGIGVYFTVVAFTVLLTRPLWGRLTDRYGFLKVIIPCQGFVVAALLTVFFAQTLWHFILAALLMGVGTSGAQPAFISECIKRAPAEQKGSAGNTHYIGLDIGYFIGGNLAGFVVALTGYRSMFLLFTLPLILSTALFIIFDKRRAAKAEI
jgi:MFS family permease